MVLGVVISDGNNELPFIFKTGQKIGQEAYYTQVYHLVMAENHLPGG
uniref:Putative LOC100203442 [Hydra vulgaris] n=1 Tax=Lepeophtheirus salmonis TaxID=72036 RepID=A0A0K2TVZ5_LEPSM